MSKRLNEEKIGKYARILSALANPLRLKLLLIIAESKRPIHIKGLARLLKVDYAAIYRHIEILKHSGIIEIYEVGRSRVPAIKDQNALENLLDAIKV